MISQIINLSNLGGIRSGDLSEIVTNEVWCFSGVSWESQSPLRLPRHSHQTVLIESDVHHFGGCKTFPCKSDRLRSARIPEIKLYCNLDFSFERWTEKPTGFEYVHTVTLDISYLYTLLISGSYFIKNLNSEMAIASNVGQISILEPHDTISTGFSEGVCTEIGWNPVLGKIKLIKLKNQK